MGRTENGFLLSAAKRILLQQTPGFLLQRETQGFLLQQRKTTGFLLQQRKTTGFLLQRKTTGLFLSQTIPTQRPRPSMLRHSQTALILNQRLLLKLKEATTMLLPWNLPRVLTLRIRQI